MKKDESERGDQQLIQDMLEAINIIESWKDREHDDLYYSGVMYHLEDLGEAAGNISEKLKSNTPNVPWGDIIGLRNRLVHRYWDTQLAIIQDVINNGIAQLRKILLSIDLPAIESTLFQVDSFGVFPVTDKATCGKIIRSTGDRCGLKPGHEAPCRSQSKMAK
jgi:uncharacterized protein with HEPN domain